MPRRITLGLEERRQRRLRHRGRRKARGVMLAGISILVSTGMILFSPIGPFVLVISPDSEPSGQDVQNRSGGTEGIREMPASTSACTISEHN